VTRRLFCLAIASTLVLPAALGAHEGHDHKIMGTIVSIDAKKIVVKPTEAKEGGDKTAEITPLTTFHKGKAKGMVSDLKVGMRVVLNLGTGKEPLKAKDIQYTSVVTATAKK
jgi:hypothetical protein